VAPFWAGSTKYWEDRHEESHVASDPALPAGWCGMNDSTQGGQDGHPTGGTDGHTEAGMEMRAEAKRLEAQVAALRRAADALSPGTDRMAAARAAKAAKRLQHAA
jgi:hypothetical protein